MADEKRSVVRIDKVYTRGGDLGETSLVGGNRVPKDCLRIACYGTVDELNAALGLVRCSLQQLDGAVELVSSVARIQNELFNLGAALATDDAERRAQSPGVRASHVEALEREIDRFNEDLPALTSFILPGGGMASAHFHLARTICRRAERLLVKLIRESGDAQQALAYLNRLSDALFVFGRWAARLAGEPEPLWQPESA